MAAGINKDTIFTGDDVKQLYWGFNGDAADDVDWRVYAATADYVNRFVDVVGASNLTGVIMGALDVFRLVGAGEFESVGYWDLVDYGNYPEPAS